MLLAFLAGVLSTLSPCVLPLLPVVLTGAVAEHRLAPLALAGGVALSFTAIGLFVATIGFSLGLDFTVFRNISAALLITVGTVLLVPRCRHNSRRQLVRSPTGRSAVLKGSQPPVFPGRLESACFLGPSGHRVSVRPSEPLPSWRRVGRTSVW